MLRNEPGVVSKMVWKSTSCGDPLLFFISNLPNLALTYFESQMETPRADFI
jgi:hypothetical protein